MFTVVVPALNEEAALTILLPSLLRALEPQRILVVDNGSTDGTSDVCQHFGIPTLLEPHKGKGNAVLAGVAATGSDWAFLCDADVRGLRIPMVEDLHSALVRKHGAVLGRLAIARNPDAAPVTELVARPLLRNLGWDEAMEPLGGLAMVRRSFLLGAHLPGDWGFDVGLTLLAQMAGKPHEIPTQGITHRVKKLEDYREMAQQVIAAILQSSGVLSWDHSNCVQRTGHGLDSMCAQVELTEMQRAPVALHRLV